VLKDAHQLGVGIDIEFLHVLPLDIHQIGIAEDVHQSGLAHFDIHPLGSQAYVSQQIGQLTGGVGEVSELLDGELIQGPDLTVNDHVQRGCETNLISFRMN
jgi:hypothetical protein